MNRVGDTNKIKVITSSQAGLDLTKLKAARAAGHKFLAIDRDGTVRLFLYQPELPEDTRPHWIGRYWTLVDKDDHKLTNLTLSPRWSERLFLIKELDRQASKARVCFYANDEPEKVIYGDFMDADYANKLAISANKGHSQLTHWIEFEEVEGDDVKQFTQPEIDLIYYALRTHQDRYNLNQQALVNAESIRNKLESIETELRSQWQKSQKKPKG